MSCQSIDKELVVRCICAWNNVPFGNQAIRKYIDDRWCKVSFAGWSRVAAAVLEYLNTQQPAPRREQGP